MASLYSRYKPRGWVGESHRHYLASKGISTTQPLLRNRYFAEAMKQAAPDLGASPGFDDGPADSQFSTSLGPNDAAKGNRSSPALHSAFSRGHSKMDLLRSSELRAQFGVSLAELQQPKQRRLPVGLTNREQGLVEEPFPQPISSAPLPVQQSVEEVKLQPVEVPGRTVVTPGTPPRETSFSVGGPE